MKRKLTEFQEIIEWDWASVARGFGRGAYQLHHIAQTAWEVAQEDWYMETATTSCGKVTAGAIAGLFTRMGATRCPKCCRALGYPLGVGSPKNDAKCRRFATKRIKELKRK